MYCTSTNMQQRRKGFGLLTWFLACGAVGLLFAPKASSQTLLLKYNQVLIPLARALVNLGDEVNLEVANQTLQVS